MFSSRLWWSSLLGVHFILAVGLLQHTCSGQEDCPNVMTASNSRITVALPPREVVFLTIPEVNEVEILLPDNLMNSRCVNMTLGSCLLSRSSIESNSEIKFVMTDDARLIGLTLTLTIDNTIDVWCRNTPFSEYSEGSNFTFTCDPIFRMDPPPTPNQYTIVWRRFYNANDLMEFKMAKMGFEENIVNGSTPQVTITSGCATGGTLVITAATQTAVGYYIPSVVMMNGSVVQEMPANETILHYRTEVTNTDQYEFSIIVDFGTEKARNVEIECRVDAFPPPAVTWYLDRPDSDPMMISEENETHIMFGEVQVSKSSDGVGPNISYEVVLTILDPFYNDSGVYVCSADNRVFVNSSDIVRLRVKDPIRALWPALGTIGVFIVVTIIILLGALFDKLWENVSENRDKTGGHHKRLFSVTSATEPETVNSAPMPQRVSDVKPTHYPVHRVPSSKVQLLDESSTTL